MPVYNKLVRDEIPSILTEKGKSFVSRPAKDKEEYQIMLMEKLQEEVSEFLETPCAEEIADIQEVLDALAHSIGSNLAEVMNIKEQKAADRGRFFDGHILWSVED
jgi:predicted house-cleaning noncanonical NTP pyrophosphatase (MazG superfamily)